MSLGVGTKDGLFDRRDFCGNDKFSDDVLWRFDLAHSLLLGVFVHFNCFCALPALIIEILFIYQLFFIEKR